MQSLKTMPEWKVHLVLDLFEETIDEMKDSVPADCETAAMLNVPADYDSKTDDDKTADTTSDTSDAPAEFARATNEKLLRRRKAQLKRSRTFSVSSSSCSDEVSHKSKISANKKIKVVNNHFVSETSMCSDNVCATVNKSGKRRSDRASVCEVDLNELITDTRLKIKETYSKLDHLFQKLLGNLCRRDSIKITKRYDEVQGILVRVAKCLAFLETVS